MKSMVMVALLMVAQGTLKPGAINTTADQKVDFSALRAYAWEKGGDAFDRDIHAALIAAVDAELAARGYSKVDAGKADVTIAYYAMGSNEIDFDALDSAKGKDSAPTKSVGTLGLAMYRQPGRTRIWTAQTRDYVDVRPEMRDATARRLVARLLDTIPKRKS